MEIPKRKISQVKKAIKDLILYCENPGSVLLLGPAGIGKSQLVWQIGEETNTPIIDERAAYAEPSDYGGIPYARRHQDTFIYKQNERLYQATQKPYIIFFDEINQARPEVLNAIFKILQDRRLANDVPLHSKTMIIAAGNFSEDNQFITELPFALKNRLFIVEVIFDYKEFILYAEQNFSQKFIVNFLRENPEFAYSREMNLTPRTWGKIDNHLRQGYPWESMKIFLPNRISHILERYYIDNKDDIEELIKKVKENPKIVETLEFSKTEAIVKKLIEKEGLEDTVGIIKNISKPLLRKIINSCFPEEMSIEEVNKIYQIINGGDNDE